MVNDLRIRERDDFFDFFPAFVRDFPHSIKLDKSVIKVDIKENSKNYTVTADIPGVKKEDIIVEYNNDVLTLKATRDETKEQKDTDGKVIRNERHFGQITRQFYIEHIDPNKITAKYHDGVLEVILPKNIARQKAKKKITIK